MVNKIGVAGKILFNKRSFEAKSIRDRYLDVLDFCTGFQCIGVDQAHNNVAKEKR